MPQVPEATAATLQLVLDKARRDDSSEVRRLLQSDEDCRRACTSHREKLLTWLRPVLKRLKATPSATPQMSYSLWVDLMGFPEALRPDLREAFSRHGGVPYPAVVGAWAVAQESQVTADERVRHGAALQLRAALSPEQCRWNFLRSSLLDQMDADEDLAESVPALDLDETVECVARCALDKYRTLLHTWLPSHERFAMTRAEAIRAFFQNFFGERREEEVLRECALIRAQRYDPKLTKPFPGQEAVLRLWLDCWHQMALSDVYHFPVWEKGVHDALHAQLAPLARVFSYYASSAQARRRGA